MATFSIPWNCPECGCYPCAEMAVECMCCGNWSFQPGKTTVDFYNYNCSCPHCGVTWQGHYAASPACSSPALSITTISVTSATDTRYVYQDAVSGLYTLTFYLNVALANAVPGTITDNCGASIP